jgi:zinc protease
MKRSILLIFLLALCLRVSAQIDRSKVPTPGPAPEINIRTGSTFELKNGLKVIVVENHKLPRISFNLVLNYEAILEGDKAGYASIAGDLMRSGTTSKTKAQIDEEIDFIGASLNTSASGIYASSLTKHSETLLNLMTDILYNPSFPEEELAKNIKQTLSGLAAQKDDPGSIAANVRRAVLYGKDHPYGELTTEQTVENITVQDCKDFYNQYFTPGIAYLAIVGDINLKEAKKLTKKHFSRWEGQPIDLPKFETSEAPAKTAVALVDRSNSVQSEIRVSYPVDLKKGAPDLVKANLMNVILGSGFSARLNQNLREKHAYTYGAGSSLSSDMIVGSFTAQTSVRNEVTDSAVYQIMYELGRITQEPVTDEELASAKAYITGSFARSLEQPQTIANFALNIERYNLPKDYYATYLQRLDAVTKDDIQAMAKKYIKPGNAHIVVVGKASEIAENLKQFGEVTYYDIYGDSYVPEEASIPAGLTAAKVIDTYLDAIGGEDKARTLKDMRMVMKADMQGREIQISQVQKAPNMSKTEVTMGGMSVMAQVFDGSEASMKQMGQALPVDDNMKKDMAYKSAIIAELAVKDMDLAVELVGIESVEGKNAYAVEVTKPSGNKETFFYDISSGLKLRTSESMQTPQGEMVQDSDILDYAEVEGVMMPSKFSLPMGPMKMVATAETIEANTGVENSEFAVE